VRALALAIVFASPLAHADDCDLLDPAPGTGATQLAESFDRCLGDPDCVRVIPPPPRERHGFIAGGQATFGTLNQAHSDGDTLAAGELSASGRAGWRSGVQACGSTDVIAGTETRGDTAFHVVFPWPFFETGMIGVEQQWQLRPRLDSSRIYLRRLYSATQAEAGMAPVAWAHPDGGAAAILPVRVTSMRRDQDRSDATLETIHFSLYESRHPDRHTELLPITLTTMYPHGVGEIGGIASSELANIGAIALTRSHGDLTYELAIGGLGASRPIKAPVAGKLGITYGPWSASVERAAYLAMDDTITIENRIAAGVHEGMWRAAAFAALTHTSTEPRSQLTGGGSAGMDVSLPEKLQLALDVEVARSYYARLDADPEPRPELAGTGTVRLTRHFTVNPTAH
jgi:hypothetical protein